MRSLLILPLAISLGVISFAQQQPASPEATPSDAVHAMGCVRAGVEHSCTTLKDKKTGDLYTLFFAEGSTPPAMNSAISLEGTPHQGMTTCMQGKPIDVTKWSKAKMRCRAPQSSTSSAQ